MTWWLLVRVAWGAGYSGLITWAYAALDPLRPAGSPVLTPEAVVALGIGLLAFGVLGWGLRRSGRRSRAPQAAQRTLDGRPDDPSSL